MRKSGYYWVRLQTIPDYTKYTIEGGEIAFYNDQKHWIFIGSIATYTDEDVIVLDENQLLPPGNNWKLPTDTPPEVKVLLVWAQGNKSVGYALAYAEKDKDGNIQWWDTQATLSSSPLNVLYWQDLPKKPIGH